LNWNHGREEYVIKLNWNNQKTPQMNISYEFSVLQYIHDIAAEETVNIGVLMWLPESRQFLYQISQDTSRLYSFFKDFITKDYMEMIQDLLRYFEETSKIAHDLSSLADLREHLVPTGHGKLIWGAPMYGIASDCQKRLDLLMHEFVKKHY